MFLRPIIYKTGNLAERSCQPWGCILIVTDFNQRFYSNLLLWYKIHETSYMYIIQLYNHTTILTVFLVWCIVLLCTSYMKQSHKMNENKVPSHEWLPTSIFHIHIISNKTKCNGCMSKNVLKQSRSPPPTNTCHYSLAWSLAVTKKRNQTKH